MSEKPLVEVPDGEPTGKQLGIVDIITGDGEQAQAGHLAEVHYVGVSWNTGNEFDASWNRGQTFSFKLGGTSYFRLGPRRSRNANWRSPSTYNSASFGIRKRWRWRSHRTERASHFRS